MGLLIALAPEVQINTQKIVKGVPYWTTTQQQLSVATATYVKLQNHDYIHMTTTIRYKSTFTCTWYLVETKEEKRKEVEF